MTTTIYEGDEPDMLILTLRGQTPEQMYAAVDQATGVLSAGTKVLLVDEDQITANVIPELPEEKFTKFDRDPEAVAWARGHVQGFVDKMRRFEKQAKEDGRPEHAQQWRKIANAVSMTFIGGEGCVIGAFDERLPTFVDLFERSEG